MSETVPTPEVGRRERAADGFIASYVRELLADDEAPAAMAGEPVAAERERPRAAA